MKILKCSTSINNEPTILVYLNGDLTDQDLKDIEIICDSFDCMYDISEDQYSMTITGKYATTVYSDLASLHIVKVNLGYKYID